jgi:hypothetical protein
LRGTVHIGLIMLFEAFRQTLNNKEKVRIMINIQQPVLDVLSRAYNVLNHICIRFCEVVRATAWAFGVEAAVVQ